MEVENGAVMDQNVQETQGQEVKQDQAPVQAKETPKSDPRSTEIPVGDKKAKVGNDVIEMNEDEKAEINEFNKKFAGDLPKGSEIWKVDGKLQLYMKVDGKPTITPIKDIIDYYGRNKAGEDKLIEAKTVQKQAEDAKKQAETIVRGLLENPQMYIKLLTNAGYSKEQIGQIYEKGLSSVLEEYEMTPEQKEAKELKEKLSKYEKKEQEELTKAEQEKKQKEKQEFVQKFDTEVIQAMVENGFQKDVSRETAADIMDVALYKMQLAISKGIEGYTPAKAVKEAISDAKNYMHAFYDRLDDSQIIKLLPDRIINAVLKGNKTKLSDTPTANSLTAKQTPDYGKSSKKEEKKQSVNDYFDNI